MLKCPVFRNGFSVGVSVVGPIAPHCACRGLHLKVVSLSAMLCALLSVVSIHLCLPVSTACSLSEREATTANDSASRKYDWTQLFSSGRTFSTLLRIARCTRNHYEPNSFGELRQEIDKPCFSVFLSPVVAGMRIQYRSTIHWWKVFWSIDSQGGGHGFLLSA